MSMKDKRANKIPPISSQLNRPLALAALFQGAFSIDWIAELKQQKASQVLSVFEGRRPRGLARHGKAWILQI